MDRKWITLATLLLMIVLIGCPGKNKVEPPAAPEPTVDRAPVTDVSANAAPTEPVDETPAPVPKSLQDIQADAERGGLLGDVFFDLDRYELRADAKERLAKNAEFMRANPSLTFNIEGHCDERGTNEYNLALGERRGTSAVDYLASLGVSSARFRTVSYGEEKPFCTESTAACWQKNRRARFVVSGQ